MTERQGRCFQSGDRKIVKNRRPGVEPRQRWKCIGKADGGLGRL